MTSRRWLYAALAGAFFSMAVAAAVAAPQVVGDEACARYAVDIASFATCEEGKVVRPETQAVVGVPIVPVAAQRAAASPFAPDARHREAWLLVAAAPAGPAIGCDDGFPAAPVAIAQRR